VEVACAPTTAAAGSHREAGSPLAPAVASTFALSTPALAVPVAYAISPTHPRHCSEFVSADAVSSLQAAWKDLTPLLDHQDIIFAVYRRFGNGLAPLPTGTDGALLALEFSTITDAIDTTDTITESLALQPHFSHRPALICACIGGIMRPAV